MAMEALGMEARAQEQRHDRYFTRPQDRGVCSGGSQRHSQEAVGVLLAREDVERARLKGGSVTAVKALARGDDSS